MPSFNDAPTPQNTPASAAGSYMPKNASLDIPSTISENSELLKGMLANNPALLASIQAKLGELVGVDSGYFSSLPKKAKEGVYVLKTLQEKQYVIEAEFQADLLELERKYADKYKAIYEDRKKIVNGEVELKKEDIEHGKAVLEEELGDEEEEDGDENGNGNGNGNGNEDEDDAKENANVKGVPFFWLTAMQNLPPVADMISDRDVPVLEHLVDLRMEYMDKPGFKLIFEFSPNEYFKNKQIVKTYYYQKELGYTGEFVYDHAEGDEIQWTDNKHNVTVEIELRKQRNKHTKQVRTIEKTTPTYSFFNFFSPPSLPGNAANGDEGDGDDEFEEVDEELEAALQNDYSVGELIKEKLIPRAVDWFTGHALQFEPDFQQEEEEEGFDDEYDDDDDDEGVSDGGAGHDEDGDDDDDGDDEPEQKPECKQQ